MPYEFIPVVIGVFFIFGCVAFGLVKKSLADRERIKMREMIHRERMAALDKGLPIEELEMDLKTTMPTFEPTRPDESLPWIRLTALCLGLTFFFGGIGMALAFHIAPEPDFNDIWPLGLIPALTGFGLLLFYWMTAAAPRSLSETGRS